ncbi:MAG: thiamine phosphate synthase, partial [Mariprofundaceae bacterium]|nr:thiamine phosphate synthase [Mariprofundaceae bacterium]
ICLAVDADGVHIGSSHISKAQEIRQYLGHGKSISASCHHAADLHEATSSGVDFALLSPVFVTATHPDCIPLGVGRFMLLSKETPLPVLALGGIDTHNRNTLAHYGVAVIGAIWDANDPKQAALALST